MNVKEGKKKKLCFFYRNGVTVPFSLSFLRRNFLRNFFMKNFSELSIKLTKQLSKETKKENGIYFTPNTLVKYIIDFVFNVKHDIRTVLEPSCGSGQFLNGFESGEFIVTGIEKNELIYNELIQHSINGNLICDDFLKYQFTEKFDLIIGNPPYFVIPKKDVDRRYLVYFEGRPNIYILFIIRSFELLHENGILAFVLPTNFLNCVYYNELRKYIVKIFTILEIKICKDHFLETYQETCVFILQKTSSCNDKYILHFNNIVIFKPENQILKIKKLVENTTTLSTLGCSMNIGTVVWNQCKDLLTDDPTKTLLIYSSDIKNNVLDTQKYNDPLKKNYINKKGSSDTVLLVNRGYGTGKYKLNYALIEHQNYLVENHCIVITHPLKSVELFTRLIQSFKNPKTQKFIDLFFSNNAINIHEFMNILPIFNVSV